MIFLKLTTTIFLILSSNLITSAQSQSSQLKGKVTDSNTHQPIEFANVFSQKTISTGIT